MPSNTLTFALDGDVSLDVFADEVRDLTALLAELSAGVERSASIDWVIVDLKAGSAELTMRGEAEAAEAVERTVQAYGILGRALERGEPIPLSAQVRKRAARMVRHINPRDKITAIRFETPEETYIVTAQAQGRERPAAMQAYGTVTGKVQTLSSRRRLSFTLYDALFDRLVNCYLTEGQEDLIRDKWDRYAIVEGWISRDPLTGRPIAVRDITDIQTQPDYGHGEYRQARGIIPWREGDETPEAVIRRLRDEW